MVDPKIKIQITSGPFCCLVVLNDNGIIHFAAPVLQKFIGQNFHNLMAWLRKRFGDARWTVL